MRFAKFPKEFRDRQTLAWSEVIQLRLHYAGVNRSTTPRSRPHSPPTPRLQPPVCEPILVATLDEATQIEGQLKTGGDFATIAKAKSIDTGSGAAGGELRNQADGTCQTKDEIDSSYIPEFAAAADAATVGVPTDPVQSQYGFHIILVTKIEDVLFNDAKDAVKNALLSKGNDKFAAWQKDALAKAKITVDRATASGTPRLRRSSRPRPAPPTSPSSEDRRCRPRPGRARADDGRRGSQPSHAFRSASCARRGILRPWSSRQPPRSTISMSRATTSTMCTHRSSSVSSTRPESTVRSCTRCRARPSSPSGPSRCCRATNGSRSRSSPVFRTSTWRGPALRVDPVALGVRLVDGRAFAIEAAGERGPLLVAQCDSHEVLSDIKLSVDDVDGNDGAVVTVLQRLGSGRSESSTWRGPTSTARSSPTTSRRSGSLDSPFRWPGARRFHELVRTLRVRCPWDREQTHHSPHAPPARGDLRGARRDRGARPDEAALRAPRGRARRPAVPGRVPLRARATEAGEFTIADVAAGIHDKLVRRHPHVFGDVEADDRRRRGHELGADQEGREGRDVAGGRHRPALPSLLYAHKVRGRRRRSASTGPMCTAPSEGGRGDRRRPRP